MSAEAQPLYDPIDEVCIKFIFPSKPHLTTVLVKTYRGDWRDLPVSMARIYREGGPASQRGASWHGLGISDSASWCHVQDDLKTSQAELEETLVKIISAPEPYPSPGRPIRSTVAKCLTALYTRAETKTLYDTIQSFLKIIGEPKGVGKDSCKMCVSVTCGRAPSFQ